MDRKLELCIRLGIKADFVALEVVGFINDDNDDGLGGLCVVAVTLLAGAARFEPLVDLKFWFVSLLFGDFCAGLLFAFALFVFSGMRFTVLLDVALFKELLELTILFLEPER